MLVSGRYQRVKIDHRDLLELLLDRQGRFERADGAWRLLFAQMIEDESAENSFGLIGLRRNAFVDVKDDLFGKRSETSETRSRSSCGHLLLSCLPFGT